ncbi:hypothetical protein AKJ16_DCAP27642 [Drosera capensis]|jgi:hypothetical protein
MCED